MTRTTATPSTRSTKQTSSRRAASAAPRKRTAHRPLRPFTVDHWRAYCRRLTLDSGEYFDPESFQCQIAEDLFAGFKEVWTVIPEGNGKTTFMGAIALYYGDFTPEPFIPLAAASRDQCEVLFRQAAGFVRRTPALASSFRVYDGYRRITCLRTHGRIQVYSADDNTGDGVIPAGIAIIDEPHRLKDLRLYRTWFGKLDKRDAQLAAISTAGEPGTDFETTRERLRTEATDIVVEGRHTRAASATSVIHDYALHEGDDPTDVQVVKAANPFSGVTVEKLAEKLASPSMSRSHWTRFVCNVATRSEMRAISEDELNTARVHEEIPEGQPVALGIDLGWKWDTTALVPLWWREPDYRLFDQVRVLTPPRDGVHSLKPSVVQDAVRQIHARNPITRVVLDPAAGGEQLAEWLEDELCCEVVAHSQKTSPMALAAERFMEGLRAGQIKHTGDPEFVRHCLNAVEKQLPDGTMRFDRPSSGRNASRQDQRVIDVLIAAAMVHSTEYAERQQPPPAKPRIEFLA